jgi:hypothetical protein
MTVHAWTIEVLQFIGFAILHLSLPKMMDHGEAFDEES